MNLFSTFNSLLDRLFIVAGAFFGSQMPQFMQQYSARLAGHVAELQKLINQLHQSASYTNKTLHAYIQKFIVNADPDIRSQGQFMDGLVTRWEDLNHGLLQLTQSNGWERPFVFFKDLQSDIAYATFDSFQPGFSFTLESLAYAGIGLLLGWGIYRILLKCINMIFMAFKRVIYRARPPARID